MEKHCKKCDQIKPLGEFYRHPQMADGFLNKCKDCAKRDVSLNYSANRDHYRKYEKRRLNDPERISARKAYAESSQGRDAIRRARMASKQRFPERVMARNAVSNAVRDGRISKPDACECCEKKGSLHGHHHDYSKPLVVVWLCVACHRQHHAMMDLIEKAMKREGAA